MPAADEKSAFTDLGPAQILDAVEMTGRQCDGHLQALASYENRVYQVGIEDDSKVVAKFYRPGRWSDQQIIEEHEFCLLLHEHELPVIVPLRDESGATLIRCGPYRMAFYALRPGRAPSFDDPEHRRLLGRFAARMHNVAATGAFVYRPQLSTDRHGWQSIDVLCNGNYVPDDVRPAWESVAEHAMERAEDLCAEVGDCPLLRLHGDLHAGNILWTADGPLVLDFDDCMSGPAIQDLWMFLSGDGDYRQQCLEDIVEGYEQFRPFPHAELPLVEALRTLRLLHHSAWLAQRWSDPAFPRAFPWFATTRYWQDQVLTLREQIAAMEEPPLQAAM